jgi:polyisoprenoid-binding protein YceI
MRKITYLVVFAFAAAFVYASGWIEAANPDFADRFVESGNSAETGAYSFDKSHSFIEFKVKHTGLIEVPGFFRDFTGEVNYDSKDVSKSSVNFKALATSIDTGVAGRDRHLRSADFFEVEKYPDLTFKSTKVEKKGKGWIVTGDLTIKDVTKSVAIPFEIAGWLPASERSGPKMGIVGETTINRRDFGINYGSTLPGGIAQIGDDVKVVLQVEAAKAKEEVKSDE